MCDCIVDGAGSTTHPGARLFFLGGAGARKNTTSVGRIPAQTIRSRLYGSNAERCGVGFSGNIRRNYQCKLKES
jgi:hypothetical protein